MFRALKDRLGAMVEAARGTQAALLRVEQRLHQVEERLRIMEHFDQGGRATYVGDGLVLVKCVIRGVQIAYLVHGSDRLLSPWFIASGAYETELTEFFCRTLRPEDRCLDVGANFGWFTCLFARFAPQGRVIAVEPEPSVFTLLRDNVHANALHGVVEVVAAAAGDAERPITLHRRVGRIGNTSLIRPDPAFLHAMGEAPPEPFQAACVTVDALAERLGGRLDVLKVDVEGAEPLVFAGARRTIAANPQIQIVMEWSPGQLRDAGFEPSAFVLDLEAMGLRFFDLQGGQALPLTSAGLLALDYRGGVLVTKEPR